jgi:hypothetical protein
MTSIEAIGDNYRSPIARVPSPIRFHFSVRTRTPVEIDA